MEKFRLDDKTLLITGGTGSFGNAVAERFLKAGIGELRIFSRDENKQDDMRHRLQLLYPEDAHKVKFYIGDVRSLPSLREAVHGVDFAFHAAALKQVPSCEFFPMEAVRTNVDGTDNVLRAAVDAGVKGVVCLSTDKAAYPVNVMGLSKAMMERIASAAARTAVERSGTVICCTRYGNVIGSRGSVVPLFISRIRAGRPVTVTNARMTRFLMNMDEAVELVCFAFENARPGDIFIQKAPAAEIGTLTAAVQRLFGDTGIIEIGARHGEKLHETLMTAEERFRSEDLGRCFRVAADSRDLNYDKFLSDGCVENKLCEPYTSDRARLLDVGETAEKLLSSPFVREQLGL